MSRTWNENEKLMFVEWKCHYEKTSGEHLIRKTFLNSDDMVQECSAFLSNMHQARGESQERIFYSKNDVRDLSQTVERAGWWNWSLENYKQKKEEQRDNINTWGTGKGLKAIDYRNENCANIFRKKLSAQYLEYIRSDRWKNRANNYLLENCYLSGAFVCELCGTRHVNRSDMNVHHNTYSELNGNEPDQHLCGVCSGRCHVLADVARYAGKGAPEAHAVNDALRPLLELTR